MTDFLDSNRTKTRNSDNVAPTQRKSARLGAVQALYQLDLSGETADDVITQFSMRSKGENFEDGDCGQADFRLLKEIVNGVVCEQLPIDRQLNVLLEKNWPLNRLDITVRAILRAGAFELLFRQKTPARVAVSEYVDIAHAFFSANEIGFINGVLDRLAHLSRVAEFPKA